MEAARIMDASVGCGTAGRAAPGGEAYATDLGGRFPLWLRVGFWACVVIAVAVVVRRAAALLAPTGSGAPPQLAQLDAFFRSHAGVTWMHILCALAFVMLLPFVFWRRSKS